jgi:hypothetical protein
MKTNRVLPVLAAVAAAAICMAPTASAATTDVNESTSANWSGYVAGDGSQQFSSVSGSWVEPTVDCTTSDGVAAFWVGIGGAGQGNGSLEQVGTQATCSNGSSADHYAWYELVPAAPVRLEVAISPGDHMAAQVSVSGTAVTVKLTDQTTGASSTKNLQMDNPDVSSAEWIAEAPSSCDQSGNCTPLALANFANVDFTNASATADGHTGSISDSSWGSHAVQLLGGSQDQQDSGAGFASDTSSASAAPSPLSTDGGSFSVAWQSAAAQQASSSSTDPGSGAYVDPGSGSGSDNGYGDGGAGYGYDGGGYGGGYGYGYGGGGYGYGGGGGYGGY